MNAIISKAGTVTGTITSPNDVPEGEFRFFNSDTGAVVTDITAAGLNIRAVQGVAAGKAPIETGIFNTDDVVAIKRKDYVAPVQQSTFIGYTGAASSLTVVNGGDHTVKVVDVTEGFEPFPRAAWTTTAAATANQYNIAADLAKQINETVANPVSGDLPYQNKAFVTAQVFVNEATAQVVDDTGGNCTISVTKGSTSAIITVANANDDAPGIVAGNYLRIGHATATTSPVMKIATVTANAGGGATTFPITFTYPWGGETASGVAIGFTVTAPADGDAAGIKLIAKSANTTFRSFATDSLLGSPIASNTAPNPGSGTGAQVAELERRSFSTRSYYETNYFPQTPDSTVDQSLGYDIVTLLVKNDNSENVLRENKTREIHFCYNQAGAGAATIVGWFGTPTNDN